MIKVYLLDFSEDGSEILSYSNMPTYVSETKNRELRQQRILSHMLLSYAFDEIFSRSLPPIEKDKSGRPFFPGENIDFNISHDGNIVGVIISDEGRVGIDVQSSSSKISDRLIARADELYGKVAPTSRYWKFIADGQIKTLEMYCERDTVNFLECNLLITEQKELSGENCDFFSRWSFIEAISKADGRGISGVERLSEKSESFLTANGYLTDKKGKLYSFAVCKKAEKDAER